MTEFKAESVVAPKVLGKLDVLRAKKLKRELVPVPEWGGSIWVQEMTAEERDRFDSWVIGRKTGDQTGMRLRVVLHTAINADGSMMFSELDLDDLGGKSGCAVTTLSNAGLKLSGMSEEAKSEEIKNFVAEESGDSSSDSAENWVAITPITSLNT